MAKPGRGYGGRYPDYPDARYFSALVDVLYRTGQKTNNPIYRKIADRQVRYIAGLVCGSDFAWLLGTALQAIGIFHRYNDPDPELEKAAIRIVDWAREKKVYITVGDRSYGHFPCGYGLNGSKDAGWTNDLSIFGSGLVYGYEVTGDRKILADAVSYSEYFLQPWKENSLGDDGYWHAGTWSKKLGSWVMGPYHFNQAESTDNYADETSWVFSTLSCIEYLAGLYNYSPDPRITDRCIKASQWVFENCRFDDGGIGLCGRDDKWFGCTGFAISQISALKTIAADSTEVMRSLIRSAANSYNYLCDRILTVDINGHGVEWVTHKTLADPMVNVGWLWLGALIGIYDGSDMFH